MLSASGPIVGGGVGVLFTSRPAIEDMNSKLYHRLKNTWIRNASRDPLNCQ